MLALGGPAIIGVGRPNKPASDNVRLHFVGLIARQGEDYLVIDPSIRAEPMVIPAHRIADSFTGHAVLLRGCPRPATFPTRWHSLLAGVLLGFGLGLLVMRLRRRTRLVRAGGGVE